jgi:hypothetical protein
VEIVGTDIFSLCPSLIEAAYCCSNGSKGGTVVMVATGTQSVYAYLREWLGHSRRPQDHLAPDSHICIDVRNLRHVLARAAEPCCYLE